MKTKLIKGFTLVELLIVITILAILGTIGFILYQSYSKDARDSKRITDIRNILGKIQIENSKGIPLDQLINVDKTIKVTINKNEKDSNIGITNFEKIKEKRAKFQDPLNNHDYPVAYAQGISSGIDFRFVQIATINEKQQKAKLLGNYFKYDKNDSSSLFKIFEQEIVDGGDVLPYNPNENSGNNEEEKEDDDTIGFECSQNPTEEKYFSFNTTTGTIENYDINGPKEVIIPCLIGDTKVRNIGKYSFNNKQITSIKIPYGITNIDDFAFAYNKLTSIKIPNTVLSIGDQAFFSNQLISVKIPNGITSIQYATFAGNKISNIKIPDSVKSIGELAFNVNQLVNIKIPNNIVSIGGSAFFQNPLNSVTNFDGTQSNEYIFAPDELGLKIIQYFGTNKEVEIPNGIVSIGDYAFFRSKLSSIKIPNSVKSIGKNAFMYNQLTNIEISNNVKYIGDQAFFQNPLNSVINFDGTQSNEYVFAPDEGGLRIIGYFGTNTNITIPNGVTSIGDYTFFRSELSSIKIPYGVKNIGNYAFNDNQLKFLKIPDSVISIGDEAFSYNMISTVEIPTSIESIGKKVFYANRLTNIKIPNNVTYIGDQAFSQNPLNSVINFDGTQSNEYVFAPDEGGLRIIGYFGTNTNITIPNGVTSIGDNDFTSCQLTSLIIPNGVTSIGNEAFIYNKLTSVTINNSGTIINNSAFKKQNGGIGKIIAPQTIKNRYYNETYFDMTKFLEFEIK